MLLYMTDVTHISKRHHKTKNTFFLTLLQPNLLITP